MIDDVLITRMLATDDIWFLSVSYLWEEVLHAIKHMHLQKALGPNNMRAFYIKKYWHIIGDDVVVFALKVLNWGLDLSVI